MAIRKNKKRIDPRYFLNETAYRDEIEEGPNPMGTREPDPRSINTRQKMDVSESELADQWNNLMQTVIKQVPELRDKMLRVIASDASHMANQYNKQS